MDIVLVAGLWLDGSAWDAVVPALEALGHRPVPLTLPGQGDGTRSATLGEQVAAKTMMTGEATMSGAPQNPLLRLVTGSSVAETRMSGARAGRARVAELMLPNELTVSRLHARFSCAEGEWRMIGLGRNGIVVNGTPLAGEQLIRDGDMIRWGRQADAPTSRVQIR